jgi:hypothetical protein
MGSASDPGAGFTTGISALNTFLMFFPNFENK